MIAFNIVDAELTLRSETRSQNLILRVNNAIDDPKSCFAFYDMATDVIHLGPYKFTIIGSKPFMPQDLGEIHSINVIPIDELSCTWLDTMSARAPQCLEFSWRSHLLSNPAVSIYNIPSEIINNMWGDHPLV